MGVKITFGNRQISLPGVYSRIGSGITNPPISLSSGNCIIIDTGKYQAYNGGAGVSGTLKSGKDVIQYFDNVDDFRKKIRGNMFWLLAKKLFQPSKNLNINGITGLFFVKGAATTPAEISMIFGDNSASVAVTDGGTLVLQCRNEGYCGNGVKSGTTLSRGYAVKMRIGVLDPAKFIFDFYAGTFTGLDVDNEPYTDFPGQGVLEADSVPELLCSSEEVNTMAGLKAWMDIDSTFNEYFKVKTYTPVGTGDINSFDQVAYSDYELAAGGTETYNQTHFNKVLENIVSTDYSFILADRTGSEAKSHYSNTALKSHLVNDSKYGLYLVIGGGKDSNFFNVGTTNGSTDIATYFNSNNVIVVHGGCKKVNLANAGFKEYDSIVKAALVTGRICGLEPASPGTFKNLNFDAEVHDLSEKDQKIAQKYGVLWTKYDMTGEFVIGQSISTLQNNNFLINSDGSSYEISVMRIAGALNKNIIYNSYRDLLKTEIGVNRGTLSPAVLEAWLKAYLKSVTCSDMDTNNLILGFEQITITVQQDTYFINFGFFPNLPVNKLCFTGIMLDKNISI